MFILTFFVIFALMQYLTNKALSISMDNKLGYVYSKQNSLVILILFFVGVVCQLSPLKNYKKAFWIACGIYAFAIVVSMIILSVIKKLVVEAQREEMQKVFDIIKPVLAKKEQEELDMNNLPFKIEYENTKVNKIIIPINPNTFKESVAMNLVLTLNKYLPDYEWIPDFNYTKLECSFVGAPLPPKVARYQGSWLRPAEEIPLGLSGAGEVSWKINSVKDDGRSNYKYEDGKEAKTVDLPSAPQALVVGSPLGLNTIIPTTKGFKTMETIEVGDVVFGLDDKLSKVVQVHEIHWSDDVYELTFSNEAYGKDIKIISDGVHRFPVMKYIRYKVGDNEFFKPVQCKDLIPGSYVIGGNRILRFDKREKVEPQKVRCITVDNEEHIFKVAIHTFNDKWNNAFENWKGGDKYGFPSLYTYNTGGGKAIFINQKVEVK